MNIIDIYYTIFSLRYKIHIGITAGTNSHWKSNTQKSSMLVWNSEWHPSDILVDKDITTIYSAK